jgi:serine/threonine protein kinase
MNPERWQQIKRLYNEALDLDSDGRETLLSQACAGDESLRTEIERLLGHQAEAGVLMERPALEVAAKVLARDQAQADQASLVGRTMSHFRIVERIGAGGMGVVYRAQDERLKRDVAVKFLPDIYAADPERLARLEREARLLASVSHPNIAAIHGLEAADEMRFLVLEHVGGETLAQKLAKGPLPLEETLEICRQIAEGVEAAHEKGIIHRDLKPANVKITPEGIVKVLDFGLAKAFRDVQSTTDATQLPTSDAQVSRAGAILGTAAYMSPEQAKGKLVDKRTDIWAFGCILFECLTGHRPFQGETVTETLAAILTGKPDWQLLPSNARPKVQPVLQRCLQKDSKLRYHDIADAWLDIEGSTNQLVEPMNVSRRPFVFWLAACAAVLFLVGIIIGLLLMRHFPLPSPAPIVSSTIKVEPGHWLDGGRRAYDAERPSRAAMAISSNGRFVVYSAIEESPGPQSKPQLYLRKLDRPEAEPIVGTKGGICPFLSPDNQWVGFWVGGRLKKIPVEGGVATTLCDAPSLFGANWGYDNSIVFADGNATGLSRVAAEGGKRETLTRPDPKQEESSHRLPSWLPNGKAVLFTVMRHGFDPQPWLALFRLDTRQWHLLLQDAADARYVPTGHLVFLRQGTLMAVQFDPARMDVIGQPVALVDNVMQAFSTNNGYHTGAGQFGISDTGSLIYAAGAILPDLMNSLVWVDQKGTEQLATALRFPFFAPRLSPDGHRIAYVTVARRWRIYVYDLDIGTNSPLTREGLAGYPIWTRDGKRIVFSWQKSFVSSLFWQPFDESSAMEGLTKGDCDQDAGSLSSDGNAIAFVESRWDANKDNKDIFVLDLHSRRATPFLNSQFRERYPEFSPDGNWIAYSSDESERDEVYVRPFPGPGMKHPVSSQGGVQPLWARNGKQLFYRWQDQVWAVDVQTDGGFATGKPRLLFQKPGYELGSPIRGYDLSLDGQRFLMVKFDQRKPAPVTEMILVQNWFEELRQKVSTGKK